ncbi:Delta(24)-sterol C-methyltransferase [Ceratobasidium sp. UAMH 11750]|nr:Delta(24)-sterol C-methyltransferase [Ceratobasidium sp. UAMH 11750]
MCAIKEACQALRNDPISWYYPLEGDIWKVQTIWDYFAVWRMSWNGKIVTQNTVRILKMIGLAPKGTYIDVGEALKTAADALVLGGQQKLFTPMYLVKQGDLPSLPPAQKDTDPSPPIAAITAGDDKDANGDGEEEVDQIVDDADIVGPTNTTRPRRPSDTAALHLQYVRGRLAHGAIALSRTSKRTANGSPETDTDELTVDEELLKLSIKSRRPARKYDGYHRPNDEYQSRGPPREDYAREDYREYRGPNASGTNGDFRYHHPGWCDGAYYDGDQYCDPHWPYAPRTEFAQRNGSTSSASAPWYACLKPGSTIAANAQGQRTCCQCGLADQHKDGKRVEKWGPGPEGPGTVCDRCRKKMKRVERRAGPPMRACSLTDLSLFP